MRTTIVWAAAVILGCGTKKEAPPASDKPAEPAAAAPAAAPSPTAAAPAPAPAKDPECTLQVTGAKTRTITGPGGISAASTSYWLDGDDRNKRMLYGDKPGLLLNCMGGKDSVNIAMQNATADGVPLGPKKFVIGEDVRKNELGVLATIDGESLFRAHGTIEITAFDRTHIAGKVELSGKLMPSDGEVKIAGEFDFKCPNLAGCAK